MLTVLTVFVFDWLLKPALASYTLKPFWATPPAISDPQSIGTMRIIPGPVHNTAASRLFYSLLSYGPASSSPRIYRVNDNRTIQLGARLTTGDLFMLDSSTDANYSFISDGLTGAYVGWSQRVSSNRHILSVQRVDENGNPVWPAPVNVGDSDFNNGRLTLSSDGDLLIAYLFPDGLNNRNVCGMKINRSSGAKMWSVDNVNCPGGGHELAHTNDTTDALRGVATDGQGGAIVFYNVHNVVGAGVPFVTRVNATGNGLWTVNLSSGPSNIPFTASEMPIYYEGNVYYLRHTYPEYDFQLVKLDVADGSYVWAQPLTIDNWSNLASSTKLFMTGDEELTVFWKRLASPNGDNRPRLAKIDLSDGSLKWPAPVIVTDRESSIFFSAFKGSDGIVYAVDCANALDDCQVQGFDRNGQKIFGPNNLPLGSNVSYAFGHFWKTANGSSQSCLEGPVVSGTAVGAQIFCLGNQPEITTPICSIDDGQNFGLCDEAQFGSTLSHVRVDCTENPVLAPSEGTLAGEVGQTEERALIDGRYVAYERAAPGSNEREVYLYDLGPDQLFGSGDDHEGTYQITSEPLNVKVWLDDVNNNRILYSASNILKIYNLNSGSLDPGQINSLDTFSAGLSGRNLVYRDGGDHLAHLDLGPDERLGTADDLPVTVYPTIGLPADGRVRVSGRYAIYPDTSDPAQIKLLDLNDQLEYAFTTEPSVQAAEPWIDGRYIAWTDYRNDADMQYGAAPNNGDIYLFDLGPDEIYGTADDLGEIQITTSLKHEYAPRLDGTKIIWTRVINEGAAGWSLNQNSFSYDLGTDGRYGTADDVGPIQLTNNDHSQIAQAVDAGNTVWTSNRTADNDNDLIISPVYVLASPITDVSFSLSSPTGQGYTNRIVNTPEGTTYTYNQPVLIGESGQWTLTAVCRDNSGGTATSTALWDVGPWYFSSKTKLPVYDGVIQISESNGDTMEIGNAGRDLASTGQIFIRPGGSLASAAWSGLAGAARQRLHFSTGINGQPTIIARGTGTYGLADGASGLAGFFAGAANDAGGSGIYADVISCAGASGCSALNLNGGSQTGLSARSTSATQPALKAQNDLGGSPTYNISAALTGAVEVTGNVSTDDLTAPNCTPVIIGVGDTICPNNGLVRGYDETVDGQPDQLYCCGQ